MVGSEPKADSPMDVLNNCSETAPTRRPARTFRLLQELLVSAGYICNPRVQNYPGMYEMLSQKKKKGVVCGGTYL